MMLTLAQRYDCRDHLTLYDADTWQQLAHVPCDTSDACDLAWSPDGNYLAVWDSPLSYKWVTLGHIFYTDSLALPVMHYYGCSVVCHLFLFIVHNPYITAMCGIERHWGRPGETWVQQSLAWPRKARESRPGLAGPEAEAASDLQSNALTLCTTLHDTILWMPN
jgi:hypothetical protein